MAQQKYRTTAVIASVANKDLPPTNNDVETALRHAVISRRISHGTRTDEGSRAYAATLTAHGEDGYFQGLDAHAGTVTIQKAWRARRAVAMRCSHRMMAPRSELRSRSHRLGLEMMRAR